MTLMKLEDFFLENKRVALGFSGGVDSSFLLWAALRCGAEVRAYYVSSAFQPAFEREDALRLARSLGVEPVILELDILSCDEVTANPPGRCYHCKKRIFGAVSRQALADGYTVLIDGTNASDDAADRPGMRALKELSVLSPMPASRLAHPPERRSRTGSFSGLKPLRPPCMSWASRISASATEERMPSWKCQRKRKTSSLKNGTR